MIDRFAHIPLYIQLKEDLISKIKNGVWDVNSQIPTEKELMGEYSVGRATVREAISLLVNEGYLLKKQGIGTFVAKDKPSLGFEPLISLAFALKAKGLNQKNIIEANQIITPDKKLLEKLNWEENAPCFYLKRIRYAESTPVAIENSYFPNISSKISYEGSIDTSKDGLYLIKYTVIGIGGVYVDYRWISIVSNLAYDGNGQPTGTYFNKDISLSLSNLVNLNSISLTKDGNSYVLSDNSTISEEGKYVLSFKNTVNQVNSMERLLKVSSTVLSESSTNIQPSSFEFTIDKTSPKILEYYPQIIDEGTQINADKFVKASDNNKLSYEYLTEPQWTKIGEQNVQILVKDLAGNQVTQGVKLTVIDKCDIDRDGKVSIMDLASVAQNYNVKSTQANWNPRFDFNKDNIVDIFDLVTCSRRLEVN